LTQGGPQGGPNAVYLAQLTQDHQHQADLEYLQQQQQVIEAQNQQQQNLVYHLSHVIKDLTFLILLIIYLFYKLRYIFPDLAGRFDVSWKFFTGFERELDPSFLYDNFVEFLQLELGEQKVRNDQRVDSLKQEVVQLEKIAKLVEKEIESEISRLVQLQSRQVSEPLSFYSLISFLRFTL